MSEKLALALLSGGLDSAIAAKIISCQPNINVIAYHFHHIFTEPVNDNGLLSAEKIALQLALPIIIESDDFAFAQMIAHPKHGTGQGVNPCVDCRIFTIRRAARILHLLEGDFLITGEVLGQRPMSQRRDNINVIDRETGLKGKILRPLSAKHLSPTVPELEGWIDRNAMLDISGRGRKEQIALANEYEIKDFSTPAGGCVLTEVSYSARFKDFLSYNRTPQPIELRALAKGRYFTLSERCKLVVARDEGECDWITKNLREYWIVEPFEIPGPSGAIFGSPSQEEIEQAAGIIASYGKGKDCDEVEMELILPYRGRERFAIKPLSRDISKKWLIV